MNCRDLITCTVAVAGDDFQKKAYGDEATCRISSIQSLKVENTQRHLKHKSVPFGIAGAKVHLSGGGQSADVEYILDNFGTGAKSLLPEIK